MNLKKVNLFLGLVFAILSGYILLKNFNIPIIAENQITFIKYIILIPEVIIFPIGFILYMRRMSQILVLVSLIGSFLITLVFYFLLSKNLLELNTFFIIFVGECLGISLGVIINYLFLTKSTDEEVE